MKVSAFLYVALASASSGDENPMSKVLELMDDLYAKVSSDGELAAKAYKEFFEWCDDTNRQAGFEIKTASANKEKLEASIAKLTSDVEVATSKIEDLAASIAEDEKELADSTAIRKKQAAEFAKAEGELVETVDTLDRAIGILEREMAKNPAAFAQIDTSSMNNVVSALRTLIDAAALPGGGKNKLMALIQSQSGDDDEDPGAPAPDAYKGHSGGIIDILVDMKENAETQLADLRKAEGEEAHNFQLLKGSMERQIADEGKDMASEKSAKAEAEEKKGTDSAELETTTKALAEAQAEEARVREQCMTTCREHETSEASRQEELEVIQEAKKILMDTSSGAVGQTYSFLQLSTATQKKGNRITRMIHSLAKREHSAALAQLASRIGVAMQYSHGADIFAKVKGLISDMIAKLEKEAAEDAEEKAYCDEEMAKTESKKQELDQAIETLASKIDKAVSKSNTLKNDVKVLQEELAALAEEQAKMDEIRADQNEAFVQAQADLKLGLSGVQKALEKLREYYANEEALLQQPEVPMHSKSTGAGQSIISILEVCESDFSKNLAEIEQEEADSAAEYEKTTQENKVAKATKSQDVKYKTAEFKSLDKAVVELTSDKDTASSELAAVMEYYGKIKDRCIAKPETYEERTKKRTAEIVGLKEALAILESETALVQRSRVSRHSHFMA